MAGQITYDSLPSAVSELISMVRDLQKTVAALSQNSGTSDKWLSLNELITYLPSRPVKSTIYGYVQKQEIPYTKKGARLMFRKSLIDLWLAGGDWQAASKNDSLGKLKKRK